jgi:hypothetical protein
MLYGSWLISLYVFTCDAYIDGLNIVTFIALSLHVYGDIIFSFQALVLDILLTAIR